MTYPHTTTLPAIGTRESIALDFKGELRRRKSDGKWDHFYIASRVAAMANAVGGTLLFGAQCKDGDTLSRYAPLTATDAGRVEKQCEHAIKTRCLPPPLFRFERFERDGGVVVAMHIEPLHTVVATQVDASKEDGYGGASWTFWIRVGSQSKETTPEVIAMTKPETRRIANLLRQAKVDQDFVDMASGHRDLQPGTLHTRPGNAQLWQLSNTGAPPTITEGVRIEDVDETTNAVTFMFIEHIMSRVTREPRQRRTVALDTIRTVYCARDKTPNVWVIAVEAM